jgi:nucleotide-binding universal stress UspA family protein
MNANRPDNDSAPGTVVCGVDGSAPSKLALRWALRQAQMTGARLRVVACWEYPVTYGWAPPYPEGFDPEEDVRKTLDEIVDDAVPADAGVEVERVVIEGHPAPTLIEQSKDADLLVVGTRGHGGFVGLLVGSVGEHCVTHAACPVVVVRGAHGD